MVAYIEHHVTSGRPKMYLAGLGKFMWLDIEHHEKNSDISTKYYMKGDDYDNVKRAVEAFNAAMEGKNVVIVPPVPEAPEWCSP